MKAGTVQMVPLTSTMFCCFSYVQNSRATLFCDDAYTAVFAMPITVGDILT